MQQIQWTGSDGRSRPSARPLSRIDHHATALFSELSSHPPTHTYTHTHTHAYMLARLFVQSGRPGQGVWRRCRLCDARRDARWTRRERGETRPEGRHVLQDVLWVSEHLCCAHRKDHSSPTEANTRAHTHVCALLLFAALVPSVFAFRLGAACLPTLP